MCFSTVRHVFKYLFLNWEYIKKVEEYTLKAEKDCGDEEAVLEIRRDRHVGPEPGLTFHPRLEVEGPGGERLEITSSYEVGKNKLLIRLGRSFRKGEYYTVKLSYLIPIGWWLRKGKIPIPLGLKIDVKRYKKLGPKILTLEELNVYDKSISIYPYVDLPKGYEAAAIAEVRTPRPKISFDPTIGYRIRLKKGGWLRLTIEIRPQRRYVAVLFLLIGLLAALYLAPPVWYIFFKNYKLSINFAIIPVILTVTQAIDSWPYETWVFAIRTATLLHLLYVVLLYLFGVSII
ncbi:hypothetical protein [Pyrobaculum sp.]|mgnify:FL=1|jgi:hypothetical protein|uniref:hypothetical protein n=1 Tax=Pyrobaculum sp. TaxID=2004705 RepID=UPI003D09D625